MVLMKIINAQINLLLNNEMENVYKNSFILNSNKKTVSWGPVCYLYLGTVTTVEIWDFSSLEIQRSWGNNIDLFEIRHLFL